MEILRENFLWLGGAVFLLLIVADCIRAEALNVPRTRWLRLLGVVILVIGVAIHPLVWKGLWQALGC